jgi:NitT/TauT family transport system substrate-binding protein
MTPSRAGALALLAACAVRPLAAGAQTVAVRFGYSQAAESYYQPYYADDQGFFKRAGLNIELVNFPTSGAIIAAALGNAIDVGLCDVPGAANAYQRGFPIAYFAGGAIYETDNAGTLLCTLPDSPIRVAKDLEGQSVGVAVLASVSSLGVRAWLESNGADVAKVKLFELPFPTMFAAMQRKDLAAALIAEPTLSGLLQRKDVRVVARAFDAIAKAFFISACFSTRPWLAANPDVARRIAAALNETARWANAHRPETATIVSKGSGIPLEVVTTMVRVRFAPLDAGLVQPVLDAAARYRQIPKPTAAAEILARV